MGSSIRELILANIVTTLQGITIDNGFTFDVQRRNVRRMIGSVAEVAEFPTLYLVVGQEQILTPVHDKVTVRLPVTIEAWCRDSADTLPTTLEALVADVRKAMNADYTRGGNAIESYEDGCTEPILSEAENLRGVVGIHYHVQYRYSRLNPLAV